MSDLIDRQAAIAALNEYFARIEKLKRRGLNKGEKAISLDTVGAIKTLPPAHEPLTDKEQRIFLAAMERERKICKEVDDQYTHEPYEVMLTKVCNEIERKVKKALWS